MTAQRFDCYTSDFCKKETWYQDSARVTDETYTDSGNHTTYNPATLRYCVDVMHGKLFRERDLRATYAPVVKVDSITKTENPVGKMTGDYTFDYTTGKVAFNTALAGTEAVVVSYSYVRSSLFCARAPENYVWTSNSIKVMYAANVGMTDSICFQLWGDLGNGMEALSSPEIYQTLDDMKKDASRFECDNAVEYSDPGPENSWRMHLYPRIFLYYDYTGRVANTLVGVYHMEIRCWLENDIPMLGETGCASFFGRKDEA